MHGGATVGADGAVVGDPAGGAGGCRFVFGGCCRPWPELLLFEDHSPSMGLISPVSRITTGTCSISFGSDFSRSSVFSFARIWIVRVESGRAPIETPTTP